MKVVQPGRRGEAVLATQPNLMERDSTSKLDIRYDPRDVPD
jgi:hypothetical protein